MIKHSVKTLEKMVERRDEEIKELKKELSQAKDDVKKYKMKLNYKIELLRFLNEED